MTTRADVLDYARIIGYVLDKPNMTEDEAWDYMYNNGMSGLSLLKALEKAHSQGMQDASSLLGLEMDCGV